VKLTLHQKKVVAALSELEKRFGERFWSTYAIGRVVNAGGCGAIQTKTMVAIRRMGMAVVEYETFSPEVQLAITCDCSCGRWGLTDSGRILAEPMKANFDGLTQFVWDDALGECLNMARAAMKRIEDPDYQDDDGYEYLKWRGRR
jgi:hypothetical protein